MIRSQPRRSLMLQATFPTPTENASATVLPTAHELEGVFRRKYGTPEGVGWLPQRRFRFGYYLPAEIYEALVAKLVVSGCVWLDVGGGDAVFPHNPGLARELA